MRPVRFGVAAGTVMLALLVFSAPASATTFCVPGFFDSCPDNGTNQARTDLGDAMTDDGNDGIPDKVMIDSGTVTSTGSIVAGGIDPLEVTGAGRDKTFLTSSSTGNISVLRINNRKGTKMSDLTIVVPASFPDEFGNGSAAQIGDSELTRVDVEVRNSDSSAFASMVGSNLIRDSHVYAAEGSKVRWAFVTGGAPGKSTIIGARVEDPVYGFVADNPDTSIEVKASRVIGPTAYGAWAGSGGQISLENTLIATYGGGALTADPENGESDPTIVTAVSSTMVNTGTSTSPGIQVDIPNSITAGDAFVTVTDSIIRGYGATWDLFVPIGPGFAAANLNVVYSNFPPVAAPGSAGNVNVGSPTNINQDPLFVSPQDFRLKPGSPSVDAGNPASTLTTDIDGSPRPRDGDGNRTSINDQGAFEFQPTCATAPALCPTVSKVKFRFRAGKGGSLRFLLSLAAKVRAVFTPVPAHRKPKRKVVKITRKLKAGQVKIKLGKHRLMPDRYKLKITAYDKTGHSAKPLIKKVTVK